MKGHFFKNNAFLLLMLLGIVAGCVVGGLWPAAYENDEMVQAGATVLEPLGTVFINLMFCIVVPMVFCSVCSAVANLGSIERAGKLLAMTVGVFLITATLASVLMYAVIQGVPLIRGSYAPPEETAAEGLSLGELVVNFFTKPDFADLLSRKAVLPLLVFALLCGFGIQLAGGRQTKTAQLLEDLTGCIMKMVKIISYYAPIGFFGFFAALVATYGPALIGDYGRTVLVYYGVCFAYGLLFFPLYAWLGGGREGVRLFFRHIFRPAAVSFGTCSSVATIPANMEATRASGISREVSDIVLPLGATMHMDGSAMASVVKAVFLFGLFGREMTFGQGVLIIAVAVISSVAVSGIPGGGGTGELVICTLFFPDQLAVAYPVAIALGNLVDPPATMINAAGDYAISFVVERFTSGKDWLKKRLQM